VIPAVLALAIGYLTGSAIIALTTIDQPRRAFDARTSIALAVVRYALAVALFAVLLQVTS
jgi:hypothetical protein